MTARGPRRVGALLLAAAAAAAGPWAASPRDVRAADAPAAAPTPSPLDAPDDAADPRDVRRAAEDVLETSPQDARALRALLIATARLDDEGWLDDAIERATPAADGDASVARALGRAVLARARRVAPPDPARLREAARRLAPAEAAGPARDALALGWARHLLGDTDGAQRAYTRALDGDEPTAELAWKGIASLFARDEDALRALADALGRERPDDPVVLRARADLAEAHGGRAGWVVLRGRPDVLARSPRTALALARRLREEADDADAHAEALALERQALARGAFDPVVVAEVERLWRSRPVASFADVDALLADVDALLATVDGDPWTALTTRNNVAFRLRDVVASFASRGEARTQTLAPGAPPQARALLDRVVRLYDEAVARIPKDAASHPFDRRWVWAGVLNDAALMRHYWTDVRDLDRAEALYLRAFELTDGAYMDTYDYNLQYLYGVEKPGNEERWFRLARRASEAILAEAPDGGYVPDADKREAARRDAEALRRLLDERKAPR